MSAGLRGSRSGIAHAGKAGLAALWRRVLHVAVAIGQGCDVRRVDDHLVMSQNFIA